MHSLDENTYYLYIKFVNEKVLGSLGFGVLTPHNWNSIKIRIS